MTHRFPIKEIARQSGLGLATIDRALNNRPNVSPQTRNRVQAAIAELERQEQQLSARGRRLFIDFVVEAPRRFSREVQKAVEKSLPEIGVAVFRPRFEMRETFTADDVVSVLRRIEQRGSQGLCLKLRDMPDIAPHIRSLRDKGIPVVTLVTDLPEDMRLAYVGLNNRSAGQTAAYLLSQKLAGRSGTVLATRSQRDFLGEAERFQAFVKRMQQLCPDVSIVDAFGSAGLATQMAQHLEPKLHGIRKLDAVYSMGGGNSAMLAYLARKGLLPTTFIAHDLDQENRQLLQSGELTYVMHHDLGIDMQRLLRCLAAHHGLLKAPPGQMHSDITVVTPFNIPQLA